MSGIRGIITVNDRTVVADFAAAGHPQAMSGCRIVADATLYYREELRAALGHDHCPADNGSADDAQLILAAYLRWGETCVDRLEGDFAFVVHDGRQQRVFGARDAFGMRPLYYHHAPGKHLVFASDARDVVRDPRVPCAINEGRIADFLVEQLEWIDYESSFYQGVLRLPPAHTLRFDASGLHIAEYRAPACGPVLQLWDDEEYQEAFLEVYRRAVAERQHAQGGAAGALLSGGMDSGSNVATADPPIEVYSLARRRGADCLESQRIYATLDFLGIEGTQLIVDDPASLVDGLGADLAEPFDGQFLFLEALYATAQRDGLGAVLDGAGGDIVLHEGRYIARLLRRGALRQAWHETAGEQAFWGGGPALPAFLRYCAAAGAPDVVKARVRCARRHKAERAALDASLIGREFAAGVGIGERFERVRRTFAGLPPDDPGLERVRRIRPNLTAGRERYGRIAASAGIEARDPYTDQRVVDFCARLPDGQLARDGWPKFLLRQAMAGRLPEAVRWGRGKPHIGGIYNRTFLHREKATGRLSLDGLLAALGAHVDPAAVSRAWRGFEAGGDWEPVHTAHILALWLGQAGRPSVVKAQGFG